MAKRIPTGPGNPHGLAADHIRKYGMESYIKEYNAGWATAGRTSDSEKYNSGNYSWAWEDGYLDRAAGREKWHLLACERHDNSPEGCREA